MKIDVKMKNAIGEDLVCESSVGQGVSTESYNRFSNYGRSGARVCGAAAATVRRASTKILMHRNYLNYHVNGILRAPRCVFARSRLLATVIYARGTSRQIGACAHADVGIQVSCRNTYAYIHICLLRTSFTTRGYTDAHATARMHESNCFIYE